MEKVVAVIMVGGPTKGFKFVLVMQFLFLYMEVDNSCLLRRDSISAIIFQHA